MDVFTFEDAGSQPGLALSNPHSATHMTGLDVAAGSASPTCAGGFTAAMGDDHEPEVLEHRPPDGMLVLHGRIVTDPACKAVTKISSYQANTTILWEINKQPGFSFGSIFLLLFHKNCRGGTFFHSLANIEFCHYWIVRG